eukprot:TRINITY_DN3970_c0_g1_i3.p1 TRINITY_DN3970_c0_g1~~TRINITY_DN3970_c0_g1_i3.p1  ORF type:complete len:166 (-),score=0.73 TRINITY_DN3970_c0_g1_i3:48-545(-)
MVLGRISYVGEIAVMSYALILLIISGVAYYRKRKPVPFAVYVISAVVLVGSALVAWFPSVSYFGFGTAFLIILIYTAYFAFKFNWIVKNNPTPHEEQALPITSEEHHHHHHHNKHGFGEKTYLFTMIIISVFAVCSPARKGHEDLTSSPPSSGLSPAVPLESPTK